MPDTPATTGLPFPNFDPIAIPLWGDFGITWYALSYLVGIMLGWLVCRTLARRYAQKTPIAADQFADFLGFAALGIVVGGRLGYVLFYDLGAYLAEPWRILNLREGGMSFHGGFLGVIIVTLLYTRFEKLPLLHFSDFLAVAAPVGLFFGRLANFINGELWGRPTDLPWGVVFPYAGPLPRHPSQLYEAGLEGLVLFAVCLFVFTRWHNRLGVTVGVFALGYGLARFMVEFVREPDAHLTPLFGWMSYGQLYSLPLIFGGGALMIWALRQAPLYGGAGRDA